MGCGDSLADTTYLSAKSDGEEDEKRMNAHEICVYFSNISVVDHGSRRNTLDGEPTGRATRRMCRSSGKPRTRSDLLPRHLCRSLCRSFHGHGRRILDYPHYIVPGKQNRRCNHQASSPAESTSNHARIDAIKGKLAKLDCLYSAYSLGRH